MKVMGIIKNENFWNNLNKLKGYLTPISLAVKLFDSGGPGIAQYVIPV